MTIQSFDRTNLRQLRTDLNAALAEVAKKHGISIDVGSIRFSATEARTKLTCTTVPSSLGDREVPPPSFAATPTAGGGMLMTPQVTTGIAPTLQRGMAMHRVASTTNSKGDTLTGYTPSRPKYPFSYEGARGGRWKCTPEQARERFGTAVSAAA